jgi:DNA mismatch repair protein MutS2
MMKLFTVPSEPPIHYLRDVAGHLKKVARERAVLEPAELLEIRDFLDTAGRMRHHFSTLESDAPGLHALAQPLHNLPALMRSIDEKIAPNATVRDTASETLHQLRGEILSCEQRIQSQLTRMVRDLADAGDLQDDFFTLRNNRYVLPVKTSNRGRVPGLIHDSSNTGETVFIEPFVILEESNRLVELRLNEREEIYRILLRVAGHVRDELVVLLTDMEILTEFDLVYAKSRFGAAHKCAFPSLSAPDRPIDIVDAHHPLLFANSPEASRALSFGLDTGNRVLIITGPNAGGKTTALKTIGLTMLMIQSAVPAPLNPRSRMPVFTDVLVDIGDEQSVLEGFSTFSAHMRRIVGILARAGDGSLVLLDELGTATDPGEGGALAVAILETLAERGCLTIVSTHLGALKNWAFSHPAGRNASFRLSDRDHRPTFRLKLDLPGISEALVIAEQAGLPAEIIARARSLRPEGEHDATALLFSIQEKEQKLAEEAAEAERLRVRLECDLGELEKEQAALREERRKLKAKMLADREEMLRDGKAKIEALIARQPSRQELQEARKELDGQIAQTGAGRKALRDEPDERILASLKAGMRVRVRSLNDEGVVEEIVARRGEARVNFRRMVATVKLADLEPLVDSGGEEEAVSMVHYRRPSDMPISIDLHGNRAEEAVARADKFIDDALAAGLGYVRLVHGHGSGALRRALHEHLKQHPQVKNFRHGAPNEGGGSVTVVEFK